MLSLYQRRTVPRANDKELVVGNRSQRREKPSPVDLHLVSGSGSRDDRWPGWVRLLMIVGASVVLWCAIALAWEFLAG